jgi:hypothetical protein
MVLPLNTTKEREMQHVHFNSDHARIRRIFDERHDTYTIVEAARLTDTSIATLKRAIDAGEIEALPTCSGTHVLTWPSLVALAFDRWPQETIEQAIGKRAASELPRLGACARLASGCPSTNCV